MKRVYSQEEVMAATVIMDALRSLDGYDALIERLRGIAGKRVVTHWMNDDGSVTIEWEEELPDTITCSCGCGWVTRPWMELADALPIAATCKHEHSVETCDGLVADGKWVPTMYCNDCHHWHNGRADVTQKRHEPPKERLW